MNERIDEEENRLFEAEKTLNENLKEVVKDLDQKSLESIERQQINEEISVLRQKAKEIKDSESSVQEIEEINAQIEDLIKRVQKL